MMKSPWKTDLAIAFYQDSNTAEAVFKKLEKHRFYSSALIAHHHDDRFQVKHNRLFPAVNGVKPEIIKKFKRWVLRDETLIIVQLDSRDVHQVLNILRHVESGHPVSFLLRAAMDETEQLRKIPREPLTVDLLQERAMGLAKLLQPVSVKPKRGTSLLARLRSCEKRLAVIRNNVAQAGFVEQTVTLSADWLLDNTHVIQGGMEDVQRNLPKGFYKELPTLVQGPRAGLPRIYSMSQALISSTAARLNKDNIIAFLTAYQKEQPLTIGELWAIPQMLKLSLIESIEQLALHIERRLREGEWASFWGNRLLNVTKRVPDRLTELLNELARDNPEASLHFVEELLDHLFNEEAVLPYVKYWLEQKYGKKAEEIIAEEQIDKATEQVALSNAIVSLIALSHLSWREVFEAISPVDAIFNKDPADVYSKMDFATRDVYRHSIEVIAKRSELAEWKIAAAVLKMSQQAQEGVQKHVGYYLVDEGRPLLEKSVNCSPSFLQRMRRWMMNHPSISYLGGIVTLMLVGFVILYLLVTTWDGDHWLSWVLMLLALYPLSEIAVQILNFKYTLFLPATVLPKMAFDAGIPEEYRTVVVIPMMLASKKVIEDNIFKLETHYLANSDPVFRFCLFADFKDSKEKYGTEDETLLQFACDGIKELEARYGEGKFFLFNRERIWSEGEGAWIGWERKRGKLEVLNRYLIGEPHLESLLKVGDEKAVKGTRYVITLDADTQVPKDKAKNLVETLAHPLNAPEISPEKKLVRGYTIIQPRVSSHFPAAPPSLFARLFANISGIDPYTQAVSDIYQDLSREGSYHGKGIYDLKAFHTILTGRFPKEHILSHDLLEGAYVRTGFASDIVLFDLFPDNYFQWSKRQHRWMRGDWQIIDWIFPRIPNASEQRVRNPLSLLNRWKIFDNLRRAMLPLALFSILIIAWLISTEPVLWTLLVAVTIFLPALVQFFYQLFAHPLAFVASSEETLLAFGRALLTTVLLPHQAWLSLDALCRVCYRRWISHRDLLEWASHQPAPKYKRMELLPHLLFTSSFATLLLLTVAFLHPPALIAAAPFCALWIVSPAILLLIDRREKRKKILELTEQDRSFLRLTGRKTWRYFDDFVDPKSNWLPPDNYQAALGVEVAQRTSPTNIGLWMVSALSACDFKYITPDDAIDRLEKTIETLERLEHYEGHLLNWYQTETLSPLYPKYVSTVDSGNFLACLWTLEQGVDDMLAEPLLTSAITAGLRDTLNCILSENKSCLSAEDYIAFQTLLETEIHSIQDQLNLHKIIIEAIRRVKEAQKVDESAVESLYWWHRFDKQATDWGLIISRYFAWVEFLPPTGSIEHMESPSLRQIASGELMERFRNLEGVDNRLIEALERAEGLAYQKLTQTESIFYTIQKYTNEMNMRFLYNKDRKFFSIGFHVDDCRLDNSYYDLLASEARISSLVGIAKGDIPVEHWWSLGRPVAMFRGRQILRSWGGTMFEYLMPLLFTRSYPDTLLEQGCSAAVACQIDYGIRRGIPWGISEAAFSEIDRHRTYQYRSFGVPGLGFKRDLEEDLVISPYSSALALMVDLFAATRNMRRLKESTQSLFNAYGFYESVDYTRQHGPQGERGVIIYAYMSHHQGMSFLSINNIFHENIIQRRFHANPRICGVESLLYEKMPLFSTGAETHERKEIPVSRLVAFTRVPIMGVMNTPHSLTPKVNLLGNGSYYLMVTNSGAGYSRWREFDISRWRSDTTCDSWGSFCYVKNLDTGNIWSTGYNPTENQGERYSVNFKADKVEIRRRDHQIETFMEAVVSPEDDTEIRMITFANLSRKPCQLEITTYIELVLAPHLADRSHPAFNKLFIETESLPELSALLAYRRQRAPGEKQIWVAHRVVTDAVEQDEQLQYETDRLTFIGRGYNLKHPAALDKPLAGTHGTVLDPIFSIRRQITIASGERVRMAVITAAAESRTGVIELIKKYGDISSSQRATEMAWTHAQLDLRHLRVHQEEVQLFQKLASRILYPHGQLRPSTAHLKKNRLGQKNLWAHGISGDLPIVIVTVADVHEVDLVKQVLIAYTFWRMRGLRVDLVIFNEESAGYEHPLQEQLQKLIVAYIPEGDPKQNGSIVLLNPEQMDEKDVTLLLSVSRVNLVAARGSLRQQLVSPMEVKKQPPHLVPDKRVQDVPSKPLPFVELLHYNGIGGFSKDGREYVIYLGDKSATPLPWINVIANPLFGTMVTESGIGTTWYGNSQSNRLTPWSNDPILNRISDVLYIRDEALGVYWTPTPSPIRELDAYRVRHGQGYSIFEHISHGIAQELLVFVPVNDSGGHPLRIQRLRLTNQSSQMRALSVTGYSEWVLGNDREDSQVHIITEWDDELQTIFAYNRYHPDYGDHIAYVTSMPSATSYGSDRTEFLGRNSSTETPAALKRRALSGLTGAALDPCAALQVPVSLNPDEQKDLYFVMGYAKNIEEARKQINDMKGNGYIEGLLTESQAWWDKLLGTLTFETPDSIINDSCNRWLPYQILSCRVWGRSAFYQSSGAFGFRDQLQDVMALTYAAPQVAREQILLAASRQFEEGDVQHWWHPPSNSGVRTRIVDDLLWLPLVVAHYVRITKDVAILKENIPFLKGELLKEGEHEAYFTPEISSESASLLEHCKRAIHKGTTAGSHGLPLMGGGDWNDGMNLVGIEGKGESVWMAWFLIQVLKEFAYLLHSVGEPAEVVDTMLRTEIKRLTTAAEEHAWDGKWYRRAYFDDGSPLGSETNDEAKIDSLAQSWAVICGEADPKRTDEALKSILEHLVRSSEKLLLLLTPSFDKTIHDPGYIKGYPPGVRENGGQYTHGSLWVPMAFARKGDGDKAVELLLMMHPTNHGRTPEEISRYKVEPYVVTADVYALPGHEGRGGWSWYTGAAGWMYRVWLEEILGFKLHGEALTINPVLPKHWPGYRLIYKHKSTTYQIAVERAEDKRVELDSQRLSSSEIPLIDDGAIHKITIFI
jgi:cyclic beta-1,2-glucan synthetase